jgi:ferredoxin
MLVSSGYVASVDEAACAACGTCESTCAFDAIHVDDVAQVNAVSCMGCGACVNLCPAEALTLVRDEHKPAPLDVHLFDGAAALPSEMAGLLG